MSQLLAEGQLEGVLLVPAYRAGLVSPVAQALVVELVRAEDGDDARVFLEGLQAYRAVLETMHFCLLNDELALVLLNGFPVFC
jgi:hypothetical protein